jgi:hypothetical protein
LLNVFLFDQRGHTRGIQGGSYTQRDVRLGMWSFTEEMKVSHQLESNVLISSETKSSSHGIFANTCFKPDQFAFLKLNTERLTFVFLQILKSTSKLMSVWSVAIMSSNPCTFITFSGILEKGTEITRLRH